MVLFKSVEVLITTFKVNDFNLCFDEDNAVFKFQN